MKVVLAGLMLMSVLVGCTRHNTIQEIETPQVVEVVEEVSTNPDLPSPELGSGNAILDKSYRVWNRLHDRLGSSYKYTRKNSKSGWGGLSNETTLTVNNDFVVARDFMEIDSSGEVKAHWREEGFDALKDHNDGAPIKRMEDLYEDCSKMVQSEPDVEVSVDEEGILKSCHYGKRGIYIENFFFMAE